MICERVAVDTGILQPCPLRSIPCGLLPPDSCPILRTIETDVCKFWQCGVAQLIAVATSRPFDWYGALGLMGLVLLGAALTLVAIRCYKARQRGGGHQNVVIESDSSDYDTSSGSEFGSPRPEEQEEQEEQRQPPPRPPLPTSSYGEEIEQHVRPVTPVVPPASPLAPENPNLLIRLNSIASLNRI